MCKRALVAALLVALLLTALVGAADAEPTKLLILYACQEEASKSKALETLMRQMIYANRDVVCADASNMVDIEGYSGIILYAEPTAEVNGELAALLWGSDTPLFIIGQAGLEQVVPQDERAYVKGDVVVRCESVPGVNDDILVRADGLSLLNGAQVIDGGKAFINSKEYPLCLKSGRITHLAYFDANYPTLCAHLATMTARWLWPYQNSMTSYSHYLVLDNIYPFLEPAQLMEITDMLDGMNVPYALALTPIFDNGEYPAMKRFCEYLRYVQSRGAGLMIRVPFISLDKTDDEDIKDNMELGYEAYAQYGVYPLAVEASEDYIMSEKGLKLLSGYRTVFLFETLDAPEWELPEGNIAYKDGHQIVAPAYSNEAAYTSAYAQAIYLDITVGKDELRKQVRRLINSGRVFKSLTDMDNRVYTGERAVLSVTGGLEVNGVMADLSYKKFEYDENYVFDRGFVQFMLNEIQTSNRYILVFVVLACAMFIGMIMISRRQIRRQLIRGGADRRIGKENGDGMTHEEKNERAADKEL